MRFSDVQEEVTAAGPSNQENTQLCNDNEFVREDLVAEAQAQRANRRKQNKEMNGEKRA